MNTPLHQIFWESQNTINLTARPDFQGTYKHNTPRFSGDVSGQGIEKRHQIQYPELLSADYVVNGHPPPRAVFVAAEINSDECQSFAALCQVTKENTILSSIHRNASLLSKVLWHKKSMSEEGPTKVSRVHHVDEGRYSVPSWR